MPARLKSSRTTSRPAPGRAPAPRPVSPPSLPALDAEWLEADGFGGFASGTVSGIRTRRYHALLLTATTPPTGRVVLVNGLDVRVMTRAGTFDLTSHRYAPDVIHPDGFKRIETFASDPWPRWIYRLEDGTRIEHEVFVAPGSDAVICTWKVVDGPADGVHLTARPLLSGRDTHALHHENPHLRFDARVSDGRVRWALYPNIPPVVAQSNATYMHHPFWYRNFLYAEEQARGLDHVEDLASPGSFQWDLAHGEAVLVLRPEFDRPSADDAAHRPGGLPPFVASRSASAGADITAVVQAMRTERRAREKAFSAPLDRAADAYLVRRGDGMTIVAGYPWFTDWGRDTFIALRGLCLATGRLDDARRILVEWAGAVSEGMLPNRFAEAGDAPEFNSVDASLWYVIAVHDFLRVSAAAKRRVTMSDRALLASAVKAIVAGYAAGTRYGIRMDADGLLAAGETGVQLTWMDAKIGDWVVTPRIGKPVEVEALWLNALRIASEFAPQWAEPYERGRAAFEARFWNEATGSLHDVVDVDHVPGTADATFRPNQIFAVGGLPYPLLSGDRARRVVDAVEARLLTPLGLRTLAPEEPGYAPRYEGGVRERDGSYHQGTVWPWLIGPFAEAWVRVHDGTVEAKQEARERFLAPLLEHLDSAGLGHISEVADADAPHTPRGCPFQAWSVGEALRLDRVILGI
ncbi:MAG TPA: amylo-alpha-1,6-glucosidase [Candidatus Eisenbacteria bacterium]|nr:amylo-alpha-1,6-glucosidase [Candidatus Eisenbacteria bacterium]